MQDKLAGVTAHFDAAIGVAYQTLRGERDQAVKGLNDLIDGLQTQNSQLSQKAFRIDAEREKTYLKMARG